MTYGPIAPNWINIHGKNITVEGCLLYMYIVFVIQNRAMPRL